MNKTLSVDETYIKLKHELITEQEWNHTNIEDVILVKCGNNIYARVHQLWVIYVLSVEYNSNSNPITMLNKVNELLLQALIENNKFNE